MSRVTKDGVEGWSKRCPSCSKVFFTSVRHQKYCSSSCAVKASAAHKIQRKAYIESRDTEKLRSACHNVSRKVIALLISKGIVKEQCSMCGCTKGLEVHHKDVNYLNNMPSNLELLCKACHAKAHKGLNPEFDEVTSMIIRNSDFTY